MLVLQDTTEETIIKDWPVIIHVPQDGGKVARHEVRADFVLLPQDEIDDMIEQAREGDGSTDTAILDRVVRKLGGFADKEGKPIEYGPELMSKVKQLSYIRQGLVRAYFDAAAGKKAARKN